MLRFFFGVRSRCRVDVSAVDTRVLSGLDRRPTVPSGATDLPRFLPEWVSQTSRPSYASGVRG